MGFLAIVLMLLLFWAIWSWLRNRQTPVMAGAGSTNLPGVATPGGSSSQAMGVSPMEVLKLRYAKGEISRAEYETIRQDLLGEPVENPATTVAPSPTAVTIGEPDTSEATTMEPDTDDTPSVIPTEDESTA
ncbi:MAG: SHOCT domain-containing protein [Caldilineaceae bacterium]